MTEDVSDHLSQYRAKRSADTSPEPMGSTPLAGAPIAAPILGRMFVVHKHAATRLHFDLRLEMDGVLRSWAVPKGPSYDMNDKRLAVKVEDHPIEYGDFEGVIPAGNYGAGGIIVWDRGEWVPLEDWRDGLEKGKLLFELRGHKLHGKWTLVKIKKSDRDWLLIKERDAYVRTPGDEFVETSVLSGLTVDEVKAGASPAGRVRAALLEAGVPSGPIDPRAVDVMLAEPADEAFTRDGWLFEPKLDGYRLLAAKTRGEVLLLTRNGNDYTHVFPEIARAVRALPCNECIVDGEVVVLDHTGRPSFARLQRRGTLTSPIDTRRAAIELPATYFAFDFLALDELDARVLPLVRRKALLAELVPTLGIVRRLDHFEREGERFLAHAVTLGLEGMIAKRADAPYRGGRTDAWLKIKSQRAGDFAIVGFTAPQGTRRHLGALQLADMVNGSLVYAGRVGTGFDETKLEELSAMLAPLVRATPPCEGPVVAPGASPSSSAAIPETRTTTWVEPLHACEVRFAEWTPDGVLRHATFVRLRDDKHVRDCDRQGWVKPVEEPRRVAEPTAIIEIEPPAPPAPRPVEKSIAFSNLKKVYWPADGYTKGDLVEYYRAIAPWMLPYLRERPLVLTRFPDGIDGKSFYQKDAPEFTPPWMRTVPIWSEESQREIRYFVCDDVETLLYVANMASIPLHIWASRVGTLEQTDWCVLDLDPKGAPFSDVVRVARALHDVCDAIALPNYVKTTGKTGLHILLPLGRRCTYAQSRMLGELLARVVLRDLGPIATLVRHITKRDDKVYLDYLQNRHGQTIVAPFSVRPLPGATVSMPLAWDEVHDALDPKAFTIRTALDRMERLGADPVLGVLGDAPDLHDVLQRLSSLVSR